MKTWITDRKEGQIKSAMRSSVETYTKIEKESLILNALDDVLANEGLSLENMVNGNFNVYHSDREFQIYSYSKSIEEDVKNILLALVEEFGEGKRKVESGQIKYTWKNAVQNTNISLQIYPEPAGCKVVEKTVVVPAQPATTKITYEIECYKSLEEEES